MTDVHSPRQRSYNMSRIRGKDTVPEKIVRSMLRAEGHRCRCHVSSLPGKPDIVLSGYRTAIFVHGCFWHRHKGCRYTTSPKSNRAFWEVKFARTVERDREHTRALKRLGWKVMVIWECSLRQKPATIQNRLAAIARASKRTAAF
jgi:DNA mismatch endonuclease, patch repair protein